MPTAKKSRGRPKGTGIDDTARLVEIAARIKSEPGLKPTTAIKAMGVTDPSSIRRLRDKYKTFAKSSDLEMSQTTEPVLNRDVPNGAARRKDEYQPETFRLSAVKQNKKVKTPRNREDKVASGASNHAEFHVPNPNDTNDHDWIASWCASNLSAMADAMDAQLSMTNSMLNAPYFAFAIKQQMALNALALTALRTKPRRRTVH